MATIDRMDWHYGGDFPDYLLKENGGTHIGMYLTWIIENGLIGELHVEDSTEAIERVLSRQITGRDFLIEQCDEKLWDEDLSNEGSSFTLYYYQFEEEPKHRKYIDDYIDTLAHRDLKSLYEIENSWENYDKLKPIIDKRFIEWKQLNK